MQAVSTNQIADILHDNDKAVIYSRYKDLFYNSITVKHKKTT